MGFKRHSVKIKAKPHDESTILNNFIQSGKIDGNAKKEVKVGVSSVEKEHNEVVDKYAKSMVTLKIDCIIESPTEIWLIEAKSSFDSRKAEEALGQILIYEELYRIDYRPEKLLKKAVVFGTPSNPARLELFESLKQNIKQISIKQIEEIFKKYKIKMFIEGRDF